MDMIVDFECELMAMAARHGFHGIHFADDWATQTGMMISPRLWRELFKPCYRRQFDRAHELGLHVWYHCCGNFLAIMEDFHEIGVDVLYSRSRTWSTCRRPGNACVANSVS